MLGFEINGILEEFWKTVARMEARRVPFKTTLLNLVSSWHMLYSLKSIETVYRIVGTYDSTAKKLEKSSENLFFVCSLNLLVQFAEHRKKLVSEHGMIGQDFIEPLLQQQEEGQKNAARNHRG